MNKLSESVGSASSDPAVAGATSQPVPPPAVSNKPAPGQRGPVGMAPRTTYSRVNTGSPPTPDAGASSQKSQSPRGLENLPAKVAQEKTFMTTMMPRPTLQDLVKEAMEGTASKVDVTMEAQRQLANIGDPRGLEKEASNKTQDLVPTEYCEKLASALEYLSKQAAGDTSPLGPGKGPNAMTVLTATSSEKNIDAGEGGQATSKHVVPTTPPMESSGVAKDSPNALQTNADMKHPEQSADPINKGASALLGRNIEALRKLGAFPFEKKDEDKESKDEAKDEKKEDKDEEKKAALLARNLTALGIKTAEDAINPAQISAGSTQTGAKPPEGASAAQEQVPSEPGDVSSQKRLIASNEAAINYTKGEAKADPKSDVNHVLTEPALSSATDKTLQKTLDHTGQAGVKISSVELVRAAAAEALLSKLAADAEAGVKKKDDKKEKASQMGGLSSAAGQSGFSASNMSGGM